MSQGLETIATFGLTSSTATRAGEDSEVDFLESVFSPKGHHTITLRCVYISLSPNLEDPVH